MDIQMIIAPVAGSVIGYTTNWLAIKMLFKPHKAYHIGKVKLPFTPGLIPRERARIAKSLGEAVGGNLLTEEVILKELTNASIIKSLKEYVMVDLLGNGISIDKLVSAASEETEQFYQKVAKELAKQMVEHIRDNQQIKGMITNEMVNRLSPEMKINELVGEEALQMLHNSIMNNKVEISNSICLFLADEDIAIKAKKVIGDILTAKLGGLAAMFVEPNSLYESILDFVRTKLEIEENQDAVANQLIKLSDDLLNKKIGELLLADDYIKAVNSVSTLIHNEIVKFLQNEKFESIIAQLIKQLAQSTIYIPDGIKDDIEKTIETMYVNFATTRLPLFLEQFNVTGIVESEVNNFSVQQVEDLIFKIVDKELKAITWLGALIGFVMGTVTIFL